MVCQVVRIRDNEGHVVAQGIVCGPRRRQRKCHSCKTAPGTQECDWKLPNGKTCDATLCKRCSTRPAVEKDLCPAHAEAWGEQLARFHAEQSPEKVA